MSLNPIDMFQHCYLKIRHMDESASSSSSRSFEDIKLMLSSIFFHSSQDVDCVRTDIGDLRDKIDEISFGEIRHRISHIWAKWYGISTASPEENPEAPEEADSQDSKATELISPELEELYRLMGQWSQHCEQKFENLEVSTFDENLIENIVEWMSKIERGGEFRSPLTRPKVIARVFSILEFANLDEEYRHICSIVIENATGRCQDGGALGINTLELEKKIRQSQLLSISDTVKLFKGAFAASILEEKAIKIVYNTALSSGSRSAMDPIEIFLALQVALKEPLNLPFECNGMDFFRMSNLSDEDLREIELSVRQIIDDPEQLSQFLVNQYSWKVRLETINAEEIAKIQEDSYAKLQVLEDSKDSLTSQAYTEQSNGVKAAYEAAIKSWLKAKTDEILSEIERKNLRKRKATEEP
jgi:hypothetical protein